MKKEIFSYLVIATLVVTTPITAFAKTEAVNETVDLSATTDQTVSFNKIFNTHFTGPDNYTIYTTTIYDEKRTKNKLFSTITTNIRDNYYQEQGAGTKNASGFTNWFSEEREAMYYVYVTRRNDKVITSFLYHYHNRYSDNIAFIPTIKSYVTDQDDPMIYDAGSNFFIPLAVYKEWVKDTNGDLAVLNDPS